MKKKGLAVFVAVIMILMPCFGSIGVYANDLNNNEAIDAAGETVVIMRYTALVIIGNSLTSNSSGKLTCVGRTETQLVYRAGLKMELQQDIGGWSTIKTWDETSGDEFLRLSKDWNVDRGTYRLKLTHTALNSNGTVKESVIDYSDTFVY